MRNLIAYAYDFYEQRTSTVPTTYRTCGSIFFIYGVLLFASVFPFGLWVSYGEFGYYFWSNLVRAVSISWAAVFAGLLMRYEARKSLSDPTNLEDAHRRSGQALLVLTCVMFSSVLVSLIYTLLPYSPFLYLKALANDGTVPRFSVRGAIGLIASWPAILRWAGTCAIYVGTFLYCVLCLGTLAFAARLLLEDYKNIPSNKSPRIIPWLLFRYRAMLRKIVGARFHSVSNICRTSGYFYLGIAAVIALPALVYQITMLCFFDKSTLLAEVWLTKGLQMSGTVVLTVVSTIILYLICVLLPLLRAWKVLRKAKRKDISISYQEALSKERTGLKWASVAIVILAFLFTLSVSPEYLSKRRSISQRPLPVLLFRQSKQQRKVKNPSIPLISQKFRSSRVFSERTVFLWLQCYPLFGMAFFAWSVSGLMQQDILEDEGEQLD